MKNFILGVVFCLLVQPFLDGFTSLILSFFEMIKSYFAIIISKNNQKIQSNVPEPLQAIGFQYSGEEEDFDNDDI